jgi:hypothetical protein
MHLFIPYTNFNRAYNFFNVIQLSEGRAETWKLKSSDTIKWRKRMRRKKYDICITNAISLLVSSSAQTFIYLLCHLLPRLCVALSLSRCEAYAEREGERKGDKKFSLRRRGGESFIKINYENRLMKLMNENEL